MFRQFKIELKPVLVGSSAHKKCGSRATFCPIFARTAYSCTMLRKTLMVQAARIERDMLLV